MTGEILLVLRVALALALYLFVGWGLVVLWRDLRRQSRASNAPLAPALTLTPLEASSARAYRFSRPEVIIGRDPASDLPLDDLTISAQHARLAYHHGQWWVEDLRSTNGTALNAEPVHTPLALADGDELRFGKLRMKVGLENQVVYS